jgi:flagellar motor switch protein FliM
MADEPEMTEEEKMAAEWAAMAEEPSPDAAATGDATADPMAEAMGEESGGATRVLSQNEIDSLLGFDGGAGAQDNSGIMALINSALVNYERLPMLEVVFDRLVRMMSTSLRNFTSDNVEVSLDQMTSVRFGRRCSRFSRRKNGIILR